MTFQGCESRAWKEDRLIYTKQSVESPTWKGTTLTCNRTLSQLSAPTLLRREVSRTAFYFGFQGNYILAVPFCIWDPPPHLPFDPWDEGHPMQYWKLSEKKKTKLVSTHVCSFCLDCSHFLLSIGGELVLARQMLIVHENRSRSRSRQWEVLCRHLQMNRWVKCEHTKRSTAFKPIEDLFFLSCHKTAVCTISVLCTSRAINPPLRVKLMEYTSLTLVLTASFYTVFLIIQKRPSTKIREF